MKQIDKCIYCDTSVDTSKGAGDHIFSVQLGEFRNDVRFRRICTSCNNAIGRSEQQFLLCGPESFFRDLIKPKVPTNRQRGRSHVAAMGAPSPQSTIDCGDHRQLVKRSKDAPENVFPVDQIVIHNDKGEERFIELFTGMRPEDLKDRIKKQGIGKIANTWLHCSAELLSEFQQLTERTWPKAEMHSLPETAAGVTQVKGCITFVATDHYFRSLAKIAFHYYLVHSSRGFRGDELCFGPIRDFIMKGGDTKSFFQQSGPMFAMPFGKIASGGVVTPKQWCHVVAADETNSVSVVYLQLFVGPGCVPRPHYIKLASANSILAVARPTWGHVYLYDEPPKSGRYAGQVVQAQITRI